MLKNWLSRYHYNYPRALVYMLQAGEYNIADYLDWYHQTRDFSSVEKRKQLVKTSKSLILLITAWLILFSSYGAAIFLTWKTNSPADYFLSLLALLTAPYFLAYALIIPLFISQILVQYPLEYFIIRKAKHRLSTHPAIKIAIAGSFGKTSLREILKTVLAEGKKVAAPPHSYNTPLGISRFIQDLKGDEEILIFELGEYYPGDIKKLCQLTQPQYGFITGVNEAHLQKFKTLDRTANTIFELADYLGNKPVYANGENELAKKHARAEHILYNRQKVGDWQISEARTDLDGTYFTLSQKDLKLEVKSKLLGLHQIGPLSAAADLAWRLGLKTEEIKKGLEKTKPFDHRLEPKTDSSGVVTLDDSYNGNPDGVKAVIEFLSNLSNHRRFYVTPGLVEMGERTEAVHREIGHQLAEAKIEKVVLIRNSVTPFIEAGLKEKNFAGEIIWFDEALVAFSALPNLTVSGDVVLLQNDWPDQYR